jgi:hypothetical protein
VRALGLIAVCAGLGVAGNPASAAATDGNIFTVAGTGVGGFSGDGGEATAAMLDGPRGVAWTADGGYLIADYFNSRIRRVSPTGIISTIAGTGTDGYNGDEKTAVNAQLNQVHGVAVLADGSVLIDDTANQRIRRVDSSGVITTVAGNGTAGYAGDGGPANMAKINSPRGIAALPDGGFLIADSGNHRIRRVAPPPDWTITTVAGNATDGYAGDGGLATNASLDTPFGASPTSDGGFLIADSGNSRVRKVDANGIITTVAGSGSTDGGFSGDCGAATEALIRATAVASTPDGGFLIADNQNSRVRYVSPNGTITTAAGTGEAGSAGDGGPAAQAQVNGPRGLAMGADGHFLIAEFGPPFTQRPDVTQGGDRVRLAGLAPPACPSPLVLTLARRLKVREGHRLRLKYRSTDAASVRVVVRKGPRRVARAKGRARAGRNRITVRRELRHGRYVVRLTATTKDGRGDSARARLKVTRR